MRPTLVWLGLLAAITIPIVAAASSPLLAWREPVYIAAGFAGIAGLAIMLLQPLLAAGLLSGLPPARARHLHRWGGAFLILCVLLHVIGLWITSPPDVIDVLLFRSPTPFSIWGVVAMWAVFAAGLLALMRKRLPLRAWRLGHTALVSTAVIGTIPHALLIEGTMETVSKAALCLLVLAALITAIITRRAWVRRRA